MENVQQKIIGKKNNYFELDILNEIFWIRNKKDEKRKCWGKRGKKEENRYVCTPTMHSKICIASTELGRKLLEEILVHWHSFLCMY